MNNISIADKSEKLNVCFLDYHGNQVMQNLNHITSFEVSEIYKLQENILWYQAILDFKL